MRSARWRQGGRKLGASIAVDESRRNRAKWGIIGAFFLLFAQPLGAAENCFPRGKSVRFIIPSVIGSLDNFYARMVKTVAEEAIGSQFNPMNVPAKGGIDGMTELFRARPSGRTLGMLNTADGIVAGLAGAVPFELTQFSIFGRIVDTPRAIYVGKSTFAKGIKNMEDAIRTRETLRWGITNPSSFFAAVLLNDLFGIKGNFTRIRGSSTQAAAEAAQRGEVDVLVLEIQSARTFENGEIFPILTLGPREPEDRVFEKYKVPMLGQFAKDGQDVEKALSIARIVASGLIIAGPPHIPGVRERCVQAGFQKAITGDHMRALARTAGKPVAPLNGTATRKLIRNVLQDAAPFKAIWVEALKALEN